MKTWLASHAVQLFVSLGGVAVVIKYAISGVGPIVHWALQRALANPSLRPILIEYRPQIEALFDAVDAQVKSDLDAAK